MLCTGTGILAIWHNIEPSGYDHFLKWHTREHMPERIAVPGFLRACRYVAITGTPQYFNFYQTETPEVLVSKPYLERLNNPTEWTKQAVPYFRNLNRSAGRVVASQGVGEGGAIVTLRLVVDEAKKQALQEWFCESGVGELSAMPGVVAAHLWTADEAASLVKTEEAAGRVDAAKYSDTTIAIEANGAGYAEDAATWLRAEGAFQGSVESEDAGTYQLQHRLNVAG